MPETCLNSIHGKVKNLHKKMVAMDTMMHQMVYLISKHTSLKLFTLTAVRNCHTCTLLLLLLLFNTIFKVKNVTTYYRINPLHSMN